MVEASEEHSPVGCMCRGVSVRAEKSSKPVAPEEIQLADSQAQDPCVSPPLSLPLTATSLFIRVAQFVRECVFACLRVCERICLHVCSSAPHTAPREASEERSPVGCMCRGVSVCAVPVASPAPATLMQPERADEILSKLDTQHDFSRDDLSKLTKLLEGAVQAAVAPIDWALGSKWQAVGDTLDLRLAHKEGELLSFVQILKKSKLHSALDSNIPGTEF